MEKSKIKIELNYSSFKEKTLIRLSFISIKILFDSLNIYFLDYKIILVHFLFIYEFIQD